MNPNDVVRYLDDIAGDRSFTISSEMRNALKSAADCVAWLSHQSDFMNRG